MVFWSGIFKNIKFDSYKNIKIKLKLYIKVSMVRTLSFDQITWSDHGLLFANINIHYIRFYSKIKFFKRLRENEEFQKIEFTFRFLNK